MTVLVSTDMGMATGGGGDFVAPFAGGFNDRLAPRFARVAVDAGAAGVHVGAGVLVGALGAAAGAMLAAGLEVPVVTLPLAERPPPAGGRLPHLGAIHADERAAALELATRALAAGASIGATRALVELGAVSLPVRRAELARRYARRECDEGEPGRDLLDAALAARKTLASRLHDACRWSLERLVRDAERRGVTLLLPTAASPWEAPTPREALALLDAFRGAPVAAAFAPGRLSALRALGLPLSDATARALAVAAGGVVEEDAVGMDAGYLPGLGERDETLPATVELPPRAPVIVTGSRTAEVTAVEVTAAVAAARARYGFA